MCRLVFSSPWHRGGFDSQDFFSFIRAANDITEIVFAALPIGHGLQGSRQCHRGRDGKSRRETERERVTNGTRHTGKCEVAVICLINNGAQPGVDVQGLVLPEHTAASCTSCFSSLRRRSDL